MFILCMRSIIVVSANSWLGLWIGLEINLLAFIPLIINKNNLNNSEAALNYFLIQAFASTIIIFSIVLLIIINNIIHIINLIEFNIPFKLILCTLILKLGAAPFHFWFPNVIENLQWFNCLILITWQKLAPIIVLSYFNELRNLLIIFTLLAALTGAIGGFNQVSLRKLLAFSSINHLGWIFTAIIFYENIWTIYFIAYSFINFCIVYLIKTFQIFYLNQIYSIFINSPFIKYSLLISLISLGGLPPFIGFIPKWLIIQSIIFIKFYLISLFLICIRLITLYYYLKITLAAVLFNYIEFNFINKNFFIKPNYLIILNLNFLLLFRLFIIIDLIYLI